ncbi:MAG: hypothetical protein ACTSUV_04450 [Candidatus Ranarchaeia archaeon]
MSDFKDFPNLELRFPVGSLNSEYAFSTVYYAISNLKTKTRMIEETGNKENFSAKAQLIVITDTGKFYNILESDPSKIKLVLYSENLESLEKHVLEVSDRIVNSLQKMESLDEKTQYNIHYAVYNKRMIETGLTMLFTDPSGRKLYTPICNIREGIIRLIDGLDSEDVDQAGVFQDWTLKYQTLISLTQQPDKQEYLGDNEKRTIGLSFLKSKKDIEKYITDILSI